MGYDGVDDQGTGGVQPPGGATDHGDDGKTWGRRGVGLSSGRGGDGLSGDPPHQSIHKEAADNHSGEGGLPPHICTVHGGIADAEDELFGAMVG